MIKKIEKYTIIGEAGNGLDAVKMVKIHNPDIVTMDITMPVCNGIEALKQIKEYNKDIAVVMISALGERHKVIDAGRYGANGYILKPFNTEKVLNALHGALI